ncbi:hypothetical protein D3C87_1716470 [compost metagenome]
MWKGKRPLLIAKAKAKARNAQTMAGPASGVAIRSASWKLQVPVAAWCWTAR